TRYLFIFTSSLSRLQKENAPVEHNRSPGPSWAHFAPSSVTYNYAPGNGFVHRKLSFCLTRKAHRHPMARGQRQCHCSKCLYFCTFWPYCRGSHWPGLKRRTPYAERTKRATEARRITSSSSSGQKGSSASAGDAARRDRFTQKSARRACC